MKLGDIVKQAKDFFGKVFKKNKYESLLLDYIALSQSHPDDLRIKIKISETYFKAHESKKAIETYEEVVQKYIADNFILKAISIIKIILKIDPDRTDLNLKLTDLYLKLEMPKEAVNQLYIAAAAYHAHGETNKHIECLSRIVSIDPSSLNRRKLAEGHQLDGNLAEALTQFEHLAQNFKETKDYDNLLKVYELILPHKPGNKTMIRDVCILYLRKQQPDHALRTMEKYKLDTENEFAELYDKAKLMQKALRHPTPAGVVRNA